MPIATTPKTIAALLSSALALTTVSAFGQQIAGITTSAEPLVLQSRGSLIIGGESIDQTPEQLSSIIGTPPAEAGHVTINQMYVEFMEPQAASRKPVIMIHGATLTGKTYDTTPDGRMGWYEYFVRRGFPSYIVDQVSRARSGVDISVYNNVRTGAQPPSDLPNAFRISQEDGLAQFRIGVRNGAPFDDTQFPIEALDELAAQSVADFNATLPQPNPSYAALADLGAQLGGAVVMGHSESGLFPLHAALANPASVDKIVLIEPGTCHEMDWTADHMAVFISKPILVVFGDHLDAAGTVPGFSWAGAYEDCLTFVDEVSAAGGNATMLTRLQQATQATATY